MRIYAISYKGLKEGEKELAGKFVDEASRILSLTEQVNFRESFEIEKKTDKKCEWVMEI